jgi:hypothetical protein
MPINVVKVNVIQNGFIVGVYSSMDYQIIHENCTSMICSLGRSIAFFGDVYEVFEPFTLLGIKNVNFFIAASHFSISAISSSASKN